MSDQLRSRRQRLWWDPVKERWSRNPIPGSPTIVSRARPTWSAQIENALLDAEGNPLQAQQELALSAAARGQMMEARPVTIRGRQLIAFRTVRFPDESQTKQLLAQLDPYDIDGAELLDPLLSWPHMLLSPDHARTFSERLREMGWQIVAAQEDEIEAKKQLQSAQQAQQKLTQITTQAEQALAAALRGDHTDLGAIADRAEAWQALDQAQSAKQAASATLGAQAKQGEGIQQLSETARVVEQIGQTADRCESLFETFTIQRRRIALYLAKVAGEQPSAAQPQHERLLHLMAEYMMQQGHRVSVQGDNLRIELPGGGAWIIGSEVSES